MPPVIPPPARTRAVLPCSRLASCRWPRWRWALGRAGLPSPAAGRPDAPRAMATYRSPPKPSDIFLRHPPGRGPGRDPGCRRAPPGGPAAGAGGERVSVVGPAGQLLSVELDSVSVRGVVGRVVGSRPYDPGAGAGIQPAVAMLP